MNRRLWGLAILLAGILPLLAMAANPPRKAMRSFDQVHLAWANAMRWGGLEERALLGGGARQQLHVGGSHGAYGSARRLGTRGTASPLTPPRGEGRAVTGLCDARWRQRT